MNVIAPSPRTSGLDVHNLVPQALSAFVANPLFATPEDLSRCNAFLRPLRPQDLDIFASAPPSRVDTLCAPEGLLVQRLLTTIYEQDLVFLPAEKYRAFAEEFAAFYDKDLRRLGEIVRPSLEDFGFGWLNSEVEVEGRWTVKQMREYFEHRLEQTNSGESALCRTILERRDPQAAATQFLAQLSGDFLTEASAMARNVLGNYGAPMSELFKVLIDEYGYGVHDKKHSSLYEDTLRSRGMATEPHAYWPFYLSTSLALINYFHYISKNHENLFRYLGAMLYTEGTLWVSNRHQSAMLREVFGKEVDTRYFDEHVHIDVHHTRMAIEEVIVPAVERCGREVIPEIVRGFEEFARLQDLADEDLMAQVIWADSLDDHVAEAARARTRLADADWEHLEESKGEVSVPHTHDATECFVVEEGSLEFIAGVGQSVTLSAGEGIVIPRQRHHGSIITSDTCRYKVGALTAEA